jgi:hypothetical protein
MSTIGPADDVVSLLTQDHEAVKQRFSEFHGLAPEFRAELFWKLMDQLIRHEVAEETIVHPVIRKEPGGGEIVDARIAEEAEAERLLAHMEKLDAATEEFMGALIDLESAVLDHAQSEEREEFPLLLANEENGYLLLLGQKYKSAKLEAPNHPHPHAPNTPPGNKIVGPFAAFFDRLREMAKGG